ncbi:hypothetical protein [Stenotrophomonas sp. C-A]|nr:hypothetical protein [Stenotrophomonas maltophilia]MBN5138920.1 hypothetical protein [Stenotrophomonas maltophilia]
MNAADLSMDRRIEIISELAIVPVLFYRRSVLPQGSFKGGAVPEMDVRWLRGVGVVTH